MQYIKIKEMMIEQIEAGTLLPQQKLPAERQLAEFFNTTRVTLREALSLLESDGKIYREDRRGWFISPEPLRHDPEAGLSFTDNAITQNRQPKTELIFAKTQLANKQAVNLLGLHAFANVTQIDRVRYLDGRPVMYTCHYACTERFPNLLDFDLSLSLTDIYREQFHCCYAKTQYSIKTSALFDEKAQALRATSGSPALLIERINYDSAKMIVSATIDYWRHDAIAVQSLVTLPQQS